MSEQLFKILGTTFWWDCPGCLRKVHVTREQEHGIDFPCSLSCNLRHSVTWSGDNAQIYSYDPHTCDLAQLPLLAQL